MGASYDEERHTEVAVVEFIPDPTPTLLEEGRLRGVLWEVEQRLPQIDSQEALNVCRARLAAIDAYLETVFGAGRFLVGVTKLRVEQRLAELVGEAKRGRPATRDRNVGIPDITRQDLHELRELGGRPDVVEDVIAASTNADPPSRAKVIGQLRREKAAAKADTRVWLKAKVKPETLVALTARADGDLGALLDAIAADGLVAHPAAQVRRAPVAASARPGAAEVRLLHRWGPPVNATIGVRCEVCGKRRLDNATPRLCSGAR